MVKEVEGNLLTFPGIQVMGHQTNCLGVMGAGIAKQIKQKWPEVFESYHNECMKQDDAHSLLGQCQVIFAEEGRYVANLFGEYSFCESIAPYEEGGKPRHTDYDALKSSLIKLHEWLIDNKVVIAGLPDHIGCGLAGGNWEDVVYPMIKEEFESDTRICIFIVKYNQNKN